MLGSDKDFYQVTTQLNDKTFIRLNLTVVMMLDLKKLLCESCDLFNFENFIVGN